MSLFQTKSVNCSYRQPWESPKLYFTRGLPRSGKSSHAKLLEYNNQNKCVLIEADTFRLVFNNGERYNEAWEDVVWNILETSIKSLLMSGYDVVFDDTNSSERSLKQLFELDCRAGYMTVDTDIEKCLEINSKTYNISEEVFYRVKNNLETIDPEVIRKNVIGGKYIEQ
jgi:predicted kinase